MEISVIGDLFSGISGGTPACNKISNFARGNCVGRGIPVMPIFSKSHCGHIWRKPETGDWKIAFPKILENDPKMSLVFRFANIPWREFEIFCPIWTISIFEKCLRNEEDFAKSILLFDDAVLIKGLVYFNLFRIVLNFRKLLNNFF